MRIIDRITETIFGGIIPFTFSATLLGIGALVERTYPPAFWWFFGAAGLAVLCIITVFGLVLGANIADIPRDEDEPYDYE